ncbi:MAG: histone deacetylase, partial [Candidatus Zixiibacteriota bacterium]
MDNRAVRIGIAYDEAFLLHDTGPWHPESPERLKAVMETINGMNMEYEKIDPRKATKEELALIHDPTYVEAILNLDPRGTVMLDPDTTFSPGTKTAVLKAVGAVLDSVDKIIEGKIDRAFCPVRPPGHHAEPARAMGFCIFNNIAIGAAYAVEKKGIGKAAIIDWDVHHGNGTQKAFYASNKVFYISLHQYPHYPGTGSAGETGTGKGEGYTLNVPMARGSDDGDYRKAFEDKIIPVLNDFRPGMIFISAGFDAHSDDPLAGIDLSTEFYGEMTAMLRKAAEKYCGGRIISVLEGGYNLDILKETVAIH